MSRVRMGVVGLGQWGRHHVRILAQLPGVDLVGVVDRDGREAAHLAHRFETRPYEDHRDLLGKVDAVSIAVPTALHYQIARDFLEAGAHVCFFGPPAGKRVGGGHRVAWCIHGVTPCCSCLW